MKKKFDNTFRHFTQRLECDRQTDGRTQKLWHAELQ